MSKFIQSAAAKMTSLEIMHAIYFLSNNNDSTAFYMWRKPTQRNLFEVWEIVSKHGVLSGNSLFWGSMGSKWAKFIANNIPNN